MQGGPLTSAWLYLFASHLSRDETRKLRWGGDLAESAEMRRAYSAMYGRYFSRALLESRFRLTDFIPLHTNSTTIENGVTVNRIERGDIPDWIAWDPVSGSYVLAEAKGRLTGNDSDFLHQTPRCIKEGKAQFQRVEVRDTYGRKIRTRNWVVANLWSTDERKREPVSLLWGSETGGETLSENEVRRNEVAIRQHRIAKIAIVLGRQNSLHKNANDVGQTIRISIQPSVSDGFDAIQPAWENIERERENLGEETAREAHEDVYVAALITPLGIRPILTEDDIEFVYLAQEKMQYGNEVAMIYGLSRNAVLTERHEGEQWLSTGGIVSPDGTGLFNLKDIDCSLDKH